jgi:hypothetical protein
MSVTIELPPEMETLLRVKAAEQGVSLAQYVSRVVEQAVPMPPHPCLSPAERAALWRAWARDLPHTPLLSDEAISRENLYAQRG